MLFLVTLRLLGVADAGFFSVGPIPNDHSHGFASLLGNGQVIVCAGGGASQLCDIYNPDSNTWAAGPPMLGNHASIGSVHTLNSEPMTIDFGSGREEETLINGSWVNSAVGPQVDLAPLLQLANNETLVAGGRRSTMMATRAVMIRDINGVWRSAPNLPVTMFHHNLVVLPSGALMIVRAVGTANVYRSPDAATAFTARTSTTSFKSESSATVLYDSSVLVCGPDCEITRDEGNSWLPSSWPAANRVAHTMTLMPNGAAWAIGGFDGVPMDSSALLQPDGGWDIGPTLNFRRQEHQAVLLATGRVLVVSGDFDAGSAAEMGDQLTPSLINGANLPFDPGDAPVAWLPSGKSVFVAVSNGQQIWTGDGNAWTLGPQLPAPRDKPSLVALRTGHVLIAGGGPLESVMFDESTGTLTSAGLMPETRKGAEARLLATGEVLVVGGRDATGTQVLSTTALFDPATLTWRRGPDFPTPCEGHTMSVLTDGSVLVVGGSDGNNPLTQATTWTPGAASWVAADSLQTARTHHTATMMPDGRVLVAGGLSSTGNGVLTAQMYNSATRMFGSEVALAVGRGKHAAALLPSNLVLLAGGIHQGTALSSTELFDFASGQSTIGPTLSTTRMIPRFVRRPDWRLVVVSQGDPTTDVFDEGRGTGPWAPALDAPVAFDAVGSQTIVQGQRFRGLSSGSTGNWRASPSDFPLFSAMRDDGAIFRLTTTFVTANQAAARLPATLAAGQHHLFAVVNGTLSAAQPLRVGLDTGRNCSAADQCLSLLCSGTCQAPTSGSVVDAGAMNDAGQTIDGGASDAGIDGGQTDGGLLDGGASDGGQTDSGTNDGGASDAGPDGGATNNQVERKYRVACGCGTTDVAELFSALAWLIWRRKRRPMSQSAAKP